MSDRAGGVVFLNHILRKPFLQTGLRLCTPQPRARWMGTAFTPVPTAVPGGRCCQPRGVEGRGAACLQHILFKHHGSEARLEVDYQLGTLLPSFTLKPTEDAATSTLTPDVSGRGYAHSRGGDGH